jgi:prepilin-type N-terminal cleavage/methylation domain-containing protein
VSGRGALRDPRGLTLIELILTLSILGLAGVLVSGALATSLRAWETGFSRGREELLARIVLERIGAQLRAVVDSPARIPQEDAVAFEAKEHALRFVTCAAAGAAPVQVSYVLEDGPDGARLVYREYPWPDKDFFGEHRPRREETLPAISGFAVTVTRRPDNPDEETGEGAAEPLGAWSPLDQTLPKSVAVEISLGNAGGGEAKVHRIAVTLPNQEAR